MLSVYVHAGVCDPPCSNGNCTGPDTCQCPDNWNGTYCEQRMIVLATVIFPSSSNFTFHMQLYAILHAPMEGTAMDQILVNALMIGKELTVNNV